MTLPTLIAGGTVLVLPGFDAERALDADAARSTSSSACPPSISSSRCIRASSAPILSRVRAWGCGGAPLPDVLVERFAAKGVRVCNGYGMTETGPTAFVAAPEDALTQDRLGRQAANAA